MDEADLADDLMIKLVDKRLRREHPDVFDSQGRLRRGAVARLLRSVGGVRLNRDQVGSDSAWPFGCCASGPQTT